LIAFAAETFDGLDEENFCVSHVGMSWKIRASGQFRVLGFMVPPLQDRRRRNATPLRLWLDAGLCIEALRKV
jgi:hypothetical protein